MIGGPIGYVPLLPQTEEDIQILCPDAHPYSPCTASWQSTHLESDVK
jgi:hypothetical protein